MGKRKKTPPRNRGAGGRPRKDRPKVAPRNETKSKYISYADRMTIALLAKSGMPPSEIADTTGFNYKTAVNAIMVLNKIF